MRASTQRPYAPHGPRFEHASFRVAALILLCALAAALGTSGARGESTGSPPYLADRGEGIPTSQFGTYVADGEFLVYPFYEYTTNRDAEYKPSELGFAGNQDFLGKQTEHEALIFLGYGFTDRLAFEFEAAVWASSELQKAPNDPSAVPDRIKESGLGDVESQIRWVWSKESATRPMLYSFFEVVFPLQKDKLILGTQDWETSLGFGAVRGFRWGTLNGRISVKYDAEDGQVELGEYALEYLHRTSPKWRWVATLEGEDDELSLIGEAQLRLAPHAILKMNCGLGVTKKAEDIAPEIGVLFTF
ncbi:MAG TPA: hypothetical protein VGR38_04265 [Candidatus Polarisedimenticolia bacterium]|nr:hypothetical protein [Candidatus Polarisedimenticolia bacterium]